MDDGYPSDLHAPPPPPRSPIEKVAIPTMTYAILVITVAVYLLQMLSQLLAHGNDYPALFGMKINEYIAAGQVWRLFTPMLLHGSILHIGFNMYALIVLGSDVEKRMGHGHYLLLYVLSGFAGNVFSFLLQPNPSLGASTSIFGLLAAEGVFVYQHRELIVNARGLLQNIFFIAGINFLLGLTSGIDNWGHLGGLLGGLMFSWFGGPQFSVVGTFPRTIVDRRRTGDVILATLLTLATFGVLAAWRIFGG
jgi:rhomboid protease GluP